MPAREWQSVSSGSMNEGGERMVINIYGDDNVSTSFLKNVQNYVENGLTILHNDGRIDDFRVRLFDNCGWDLDDYATDEATKAFGTWLENGGYTDPGFHIIVHGESEAGLGSSSGKFAWDGFSYGSTNAEQKGYSVKSTGDGVLHEACHMFIDDDEVSNLLYNGNSHTLGKYYERYVDGTKTIMESPYAGGQTSNTEGNCSNPTLYPDTSTYDFTECSRKGIERTHDNFK